MNHLFMLPNVPHDLVPGTTPKRHIPPCLRWILQWLQQLPVAGRRRLRSCSGNDECEQCELFQYLHVIFVYMYIYIYFSIYIYIVKAGVYKRVPLDGWVDMQSRPSINMCPAQAHLCLVRSQPTILGPRAHGHIVDFVSWVNPRFM